MSVGGRVESIGVAALLDRALALDPLKLPADVVATAVDLLVDHFGVAIRGHAQPWTRMVQATLAEEESAPRSTIYGAGRSCARNAALVNGTAGHALELDDTHDASLTHPGSAIIPAALAVAEAVSAPPRALLGAIASGYEVTARIGMRIGASLIRRGVHPTASLGIFGAAVAAGRLLDLDRERLFCAIGLAGAMSSGSMQFAHDPARNMVKRLYGGLPAERGVLAAQLAAHGMTAPRGAIDGAYGIARVLGLVEDMQWPAIDAETPYEITRVSIKLYPCCKNFHALIEAILECRAGRRWTVDDIADVVVHGPRAMIEHHLETRPDSTMAAQYSLPWTTAVALVDDPTSVDLFDDAARRRGDLLSLTARVATREDPRLEAAFPAHFAGAVDVRLRTGETLHAEVLDARGTPARPVERDAIVDKFRRLTAPVLEPAAADALLYAVERLPQARSLVALGNALAFRPRPHA